MARANFQRRIYLQDALLACRSEFMACATAGIVDNEAAMLLIRQLFDLETRLDMLRCHMSAEESDPGGLL